MRDQNLTKVTPLPAAASTSSPTGLDTNASPVCGDLGNHAFFHITCPATPALADAKTIIFTIEHSDSASSGFSAVPGISPHTITGSGGAGAAAVDEFRPIPRSTRRFVRCTAAVLTAGGDSTALSYTFSVDLNPIR